MLPLILDFLDDAAIVELWSFSVSYLVYSKKLLPTMMLVKVSQNFLIPYSNAHIRMKPATNNQ